MRMYSQIFVVLAFLYLFSSTAMAFPDDTLVVHLAFDAGDGDEVMDDSIYGNSGTIIGNPRWVAGKSGTALEFDGSGDSVEIFSSDSVNVTKAITMEMWVKTLGGAEVKQAGIEKGSWQLGEYSLYPVYEGGTVAQFFDLPAACGDAGVRGPGIPDENWHYLAGVWDGTAISIYIDGELEISRQCEGELKASNQSVHIGSRMAGERFLTGAVDEVRIYNRALTQEEIKKDMNTFGKLAVLPMHKLATLWGNIKS